MVNILYLYDNVDKIAEIFLIYIISNAQIVIK